MSEPVWDGTGVPPVPVVHVKKAKDSEPKAPTKKNTDKAPAKTAKSKPTEE